MNVLGHESRSVWKISIFGAALGWLGTTIGCSFIQRTMHRGQMHQNLPEGTWVEGWAYRRQAKNGTSAEQWRVVGVVWAAWRACEWDFAQQITYFWPWGSQWQSTLYTCTPSSESKRFMVAGLHRQPPHTPVPYRQRQQREFLSNQIIPTAHFLHLNTIDIAHPIRMSSSVATCSGATKQLTWSLTFPSFGMWSIVSVLNSLQSCTY